MFYLVIYNDENIAPHNVILILSVKLHLKGVTVITTRICFLDCLKKKSWFSMNISSFRIWSSKRNARISQRYINFKFEVDLP